MLPIKLSNKGFPADNAMKYQRHSVLRDKLTATNNYIIKINERKTYSIYLPICELLSK